MSQLVRISTRPPAPSVLTRAKAALQAVRAAWSGPYSLKDQAWSRLFGSGYENYAGIAVTDENAMTFSAVFSAVLQISSDVAKLPLNLHKRRQGGGSDHYTDSRLYYLLKQEPNPESSSMMFRQTLTAHALTCHGGYAEIERDLHGRPKALWILTPDRVEPLRRDQYDRQTGRKFLGPLEYRIDGNDDTILPARDVIHISGLGYDGITGYSVIHKARQAIGLALAMEKFGGQYFGKGTVFGGWLETDSDLDEEQKKDIKGNIEAFRKAQDSAWRILVTGSGHKFHQFTSKPSESQMDESRTAQVLEVARFFRMPPVKLGVNTPGTVSYASSEQADLDYYKGPMLDWITREEQEFNRKLIPPSERRQQFIKHNATAFLRADTKARSDFYGAMLDRGVFNADDVLELEDLNPQPDGVGKMYLVQGAQIPKHQLEKVVDAKIKKANTPKPTPAAPTPADDPDDNRGREILDTVTAAMSTFGAQLQVLTAQQRDVTACQAELETERGIVAARSAELADARAEAMRLVADRDAAITRAAESAALAQTATSDREAHALAAETARREAIAASQRADDAAAAQQDAEAAAAAAAERLTMLEASQATLTAELESTRARVAELQQQLTTEQQAAATSAAERAAAAVDAASAAAAIETARDHAFAEAEALRNQLQVMEAAHAVNLAEARADADRAAHAAEVAPVQAALEATRATQATLEARVAELEAATADATAAADRARQHLEGERASRIERMTQTIAAHRGLIADVLGRMTRRQAQQARAKQATPEKLRRWLAGVVSVEAPICQEALLPAIRVRLAAKGSTEDPAQVTAGIVAEHLSTFEALMRDVLDAPPEDFHAELERVLERWETERPGTVADALLEEEVRHVRAL